MSSNESETVADTVLDYHNGGFMKTYTMEIRTTFTKWVEVQAEDYDQAREKAWEYIEEHDALRHADIDTEVSHVYGRPADEYEPADLGGLKND